MLVYIYTKGYTIEPESESRIDVCVECCVRDRDFSQKKVYHCELCDRWFCERHIDPRLAFIKDLNVVGNSPEVRALHYTEMQREDGHPDFAYTQIKFLELDIEEKNRNELIKQALDRMNHYYDNALIPEKPIDAEEERKKRVEMLLKEEAEIDKEQKQVKTTEKKPKTRKPFPAKKAIGAVLAVIIIGALVWYAPPIISYIASHVTSSQNNAQPSWNTETFQLVQANLLAPVMISRHFELQSGNHLVGNFQFINLPSSDYEIGVAILDPLQGTLQVFENKTSGSFDITASISGAYEMNFGFTCTREVTPPSVTLKTRITS